VQVMSRKYLIGFCPIDCLNSLATVAALPGYSKPQFTEEDVLEIVQGRHPMGEAIRSDPFVPNDLYLGEVYTPLRVPLIHECALNLHLESWSPQDHHRYFFVFQVNLEYYELISLPKVQTWYVFETINASSNYLIDFNKGRQKFLRQVCRLYDNHKWDFSKSINYFRMTALIAGKHPKHRKGRQPC
jgi:hypothetical protein